MSSLANLWLKHFATLLATLLTPLAAWAQTPELPTHARLDLRGLEPELRLTDPMALPMQARLDRMRWLGMTFGSEQSLTLELPLVSYADSVGKIRFTPSQDGRVGVWLRGPWDDAPAAQSQIAPVVFHHFSVLGATPVHAYAEQTQPQGREVWLPGHARHADPLYLELKVFGKVPVTVTFSACSQELRAIQPGLIKPAHQWASQFSKGINLAGWLEVPRGETWAQPVTDDEFARIRQEGFDHVRLAINWHQHTGPAPQFKVSESLFATVDRVLGLATKAGLAVVLSPHGYESLMEQPRNELPRFRELWLQIARRYRSHPGRIAYELVNEPHGYLEGRLLNAVQQQMVKEIRKIDGQRPIMLSPGGWATVEHLEAFQIPRDPNLIVQIHLYEPFPVSNLGAFWREDLVDLKGISFPGPPPHSVSVPSGASAWLKHWIDQHNRAPLEMNPAGPFEIEYRLELASAWGRRNQVPIYLGEFGAVTTLDAASRQAYVRCIRQAAENRGMGWAMWEWKTSFAYYDASLRQPMPGMREALFD